MATLIPTTPTASREWRPYIEITTIPRPLYSSTKSTMSPSSVLKRKLSNANENHPRIPTSSSSVKKRRVEVVIANRSQTIDSKTSVPAIAHRSLQIMATSTQIFDPQLSILERARIDPTQPCPVRWRVTGADFDRELIENRMQLREFAHRFQALLQLPKTHLEALNYFEPAKFTDLTCRAYIVSLLNIIYEDESDTTIQQELSSAIKQLKSPRSQLSAMEVWTLLESLEPCFAITEGLARPSPKAILDDVLLQSAEMAARRTTRRTKASSSSGGPTTSKVDVVHPVQLIPVLVSLTHEASKTSAIRQELDDGVKAAKSITQNRVTESKQETKRWSIIRKDLYTRRDQDKLSPQPGLSQVEWTHKITQERETHNQALLAIDVHHAAQLQACRLRFSPLGTDEGGRVYYALSTPLTHSDTYDSLSTNKNGAMKSKGRLTRPPRTETAMNAAKRDRKESWAYRVFVWGKKPLVQVTDASSRPVDEENEDNDCEQWWGFDDATSIRSLAEWLIRDTISKDATLSSTQAQFSFLSNMPISASTVGIRPINATSTSMSASLSSPLPITAQSSQKTIPHSQTAIANATVVSTNKRSSAASMNVSSVRALYNGLVSFAAFLDVRFGKDEEEG